MVPLFITKEHKTQNLNLILNYQLNINTASSGLSFKLSFICLSYSLKHVIN